MTSAIILDRPAPKPARGLELVLTRCPLCGKDEGEPLAVGNDFAHGITPDSFLVLSCPACGLVYLNPRPAPEEWPRLHPPEYFMPSGSGRLSADGLGRGTVGALVQSCGVIAPNARILEVGYGARLHLDQLRRVGPPSWVLEAVTPHESLARAAREAGLIVYHGRPQALEDSGTAYDLILLLHALEHCEAPLDELVSLRRLLRPGGRLVVVTPNAASRACRLFRGRHWAGYDFPRHPCLFGPDTLRRLAAATGFSVERLGTRSDAQVWTRSAENFLRDWAAPAWLTRAAPRGFVVLSGLAALPGLFGRPQAGGGQLEAVLRKPVEAPA
jgi:SAM-dependent methyltransferase